MEQQPIISVIIPVFNEGANLSLCLDSLLNNAEKRVELIVVDDGSTDNSLDIAHKYASVHNSIRVISQPRQGVCAARNQGLNEARGEFVTFVDGDAYVEEHLLDHYLHLQEQGNYDLVICGIDTDTNDHANRELNQEEMLGLLFQQPEKHACVWNKLYRTSIVRRCNLQFEGVYGYNADRLFNFQYIRHAGQALHSQRLYYHCVERKGNLMKRDLSQHQYGALDGFERMLYYSRKYSPTLQNAIIQQYVRYALHISQQDASMRVVTTPILQQLQPQLTGWLRWQCRLFLCCPSLARFFLI